jgi:hypothetical protein
MKLNAFDFISYVAITLAPWAVVDGADYNGETVHFYGYGFQSTLLLFMVAYFSLVASRFKK